MIYAFADCMLDTRLYTLCRTEGPTERVVPIQPRAFQVLIYLLENCDHVVSKDELIEHVWSNECISNAALESTIRLVRRAIGDSGREQRLIQTRQGWGYRFIAPVEVYLKDNAAQEVVGIPSIPTEERGPPREPRPEAIYPSSSSKSGRLATTQTDEPSQPISACRRPRISGTERRQLTVLFCDLVGSTYLSGHLEPEDYRDVLHAYYQVCEDVVQQYDGHIAQYQGDGLLIYFGYPQAHEDDARRAILAGLDLITGIDTLNCHLRQDKATELAVRIAVHTGLVVVDEKGEKSRPEHLALGEALNVAAHLQSLAAPGTVIVSEATRQLTQGLFICEALGDFQLKGMVTSLSVYRVLQVSGAQSRFDVAVTRGLTPLIGREQEIGIILDRWERVKESEGHVVVLSGEADIGKSRLLQELKNRLADSAVTLECRCSPYHQGTAFYPLIDFLQRTLGWQDDASARSRQQKLEALVAEHALPRVESVPLLATLLSLPLPEDQYPPLSRLANAVAQDQPPRQKILEILLALLVEQARQKPVVFMIEDLHWSDPSTLEFLDLLIERAPMAAILTVLTCLRQIVEAELCYQHGVLPQANYQFKHALIRDAAYDSLLRSHRRDIHGQIARVLESDPHVKEHEPETIARHYEAAQEIELAIAHWEQAGYQARQRSANQESAGHFVHAIDLLKLIGEERERTELELKLRVELAGQLIACYGNGAPEVEENCERAQAILGNAHDQRLIFRVRHSLRMLYMTRGPLQKSKEIGEQLLEQATKLGDDSMLLQAHRPHGLCLLYMGELKPARYHLERTIVLYRYNAHSSQRFEYISDPLVLARSNLGWLACFLGDCERALDQTDRAVAFAEELDHKHSLAFALGFAASIRQTLGMIKETQAFADRLLSLSTSCNYPYWVAWAQMLRGWAGVHAGDRERGAEEFRDGFGSHRGTGARFMVPYFFVLLAEMDLQRREPGQALVHLEEARQLIDITGVRFYEAELYRLMSYALMAQQDKPDKVRQTLLNAIDIAANQGNVLFQLAAQRSLDELLSS